VGTCRVWRGSTAGGSFTALSNTFDGVVTCPGQGGQVDLVRGLAAGGPTSGGFSNVVYATTEGSGPNNGFVAGEVWATTNAAGGPAQFTNRTFNGPSGTINPNNYVVSSVALDKSDASGQTAYVGIMGFVGTGTHIWKTTNAGLNWTAFGSTANGLPDSPVNALVVDSGTVYAGTDVGIFQSPTSGVSWTEVGPNAQPGATGYLPNVAVTAIRLFNSGGVKKLRVSTYGRGIWEFALAVAPDFTNVISDSPQTVFPTQNATFHGTLAVQNAYNNAVNLSCTAGGTAPPTTCTLNPTQVPAPGSGTYTVTAGGAVGDYSFNAHAVGTDANTKTHDAAVTLHVVDFTLGVPNPNALTVQQGGTATSTFQVSALGAFSGTVSLSCSGLPANASCGFAPSANVNPTLGNPVTVTMTVSAAANTPVGGPTTVILQASTPGAPAAKTQNFTVTVTAPPNFTWTGGGAHTVLAGQTTLSYAFTATPTGGPFTTDVTFGCSNLPDSTVACVFNTGQADPTKIAAGSGPTAVAVTITTKGPNTGTGTSRSQRADKQSPWLPLTLPIAGIIMVGITGKRVSRRSAMAGMCVSFVLLALLVACGGGSSAPPPPPPISVTVSPSTTVNLYANETGNAWPPNLTQQQFTAVVNNSTNQSVTWAVTGGAANGSIDATSGLYTAPPVVPNPAAVTVKATAAADTSKSGTGKLNILTPTVLGTFPSISVTATEGVVSHSQNVSLTVN